MLVAVRSPNGDAHSSEGVDQGFSEPTIHMA